MREVKNLNKNLFVFKKGEVLGIFFFFFFFSNFTTEYRI